MVQYDNAKLNALILSDPVQYGWLKKYRCEDLTFEHGNIYRLYLCNPTDYGWLKDYRIDAPVDFADTLKVLQDRVKFAAKWQGQTMRTAGVSACDCSPIRLTNWRVMPATWRGSMRTRRYSPTNCCSDSDK